MEIMEMLNISKEQFMYVYLGTTLALILFFVLVRIFLKTKNAQSLYKSEKILKLEYSFSIARTYAYGFTCGSFILLLQSLTLQGKPSNELIIFTCLSVLSLLFITFEESMKLGKKRFESFLDGIDGILFNFLPANILYIFFFTFPNTINITIDENYKHNADTFLFNIENIIVEANEYILPTYLHHFILSLFLIGFSFWILSLTHIYRAKKVRQQESTLNNYQI